MLKICIEFNYSILEKVPTTVFANPQESWFMCLWIRQTNCTLLKTWCLKYKHSITINSILNEIEFYRLMFASYFSMSFAIHI